MNPNVVYPGNAQTYMESYPNLTVVTPGTVQVGYDNAWGAAPMWVPVEALIQQNGWYTFATTYLRTGNQTTDPAVQVSEVLSPSGMLMGYEVGYGTYFVADIQSSDLYGPDEVILESYQPGFAGNNLGVTQVRSYLGFPNPTKSPVVSNSGNVEATLGTAVSYQITASLASTKYQALQLPPGLSVNATSGLIFGTPTAAGTYPVILAAANASGVGVATVDFVVAEAPATTSATFVKLDTTTQGSWSGVYGTMGYNVSQDSKIMNPSYATVTFNGQSNWTWATNQTDVRALQMPEALTKRIAACWFSWTSESINVNITDGSTHQVALYALDWDSTVRAETVTVTNAATGAVLNTQILPAGSFHVGEYLVWKVSGNVTFTVRVTGGANAVLSGVFFDP
jgi:hypothetical protein